jgi:hypothetical protein
VRSHKAAKSDLSPYPSQYFLIRRVLRLLSRCVQLQLVMQRLNSWHLPLFQKEKAKRLSNCGNVSRQHLHCTLSIFLLIIFKRHIKVFALPNGDNLLHADS